MSVSVLRMALRGRVKMIMQSTWNLVRSVQFEGSRCRSLVAVRYVALAARFVCVESSVLCLPI